MHERDDHDNAIFLTLTYDDDHLPPDNRVSKEALVLFLKRLRKRLGDRKLKYYATGEYGESNGRAHYHAIMYGLSALDEDDITAAWQHMGAIHIGTVTYDSARYVADYVHKLKYEKRTGQPFAIMSNGLGKGYALRNAEKLREDPTITIHGTSVGVPKYYQKKIDELEETRFRDYPNLGPPQKIAAALKRKKEERLEEIAEYYDAKFTHAEEVWKRIQKHRNQTNHNLRKKAELFQRGTL